MQVIDAENGPLTIQLLHRAFGVAWWGEVCPKAITGNPVVVGWAKNTVQRTYGAQSNLFCGAKLVEDHSIPDGELHFLIPEDNEKSSKIVNIRTSVPLTA